MLQPAAGVPGGDVRGGPGSGAKIQVDFAGTAGASAGALLPTGNPCDRLNIKGVGKIDVSMVDIGNAHAFVRAVDLGCSGTESAATIDADTELSRILERIRAHAGVAMGMIDDPEKAAKVSPATPFVAMVEGLCFASQRRARFCSSQRFSKKMFVEMVEFSKTFFEMVDLK